MLSYATDMKKVFSQYAGPILIITAAILWAFDGVLRRSLFSLPAITIVFLEHAVGLVVLSPLLLQSVRGFFTLKTKEKMLLLWVALASSLLGTLWFTKALLATNFLPLSVVFLLQKLQPIFVIVTSAVFLKEKFSPRYWKWALTAFLAAYFVTFPTGRIDLATGSGTAIAALYALLAALAWGSSTVFSRYLLGKLPDAQVTTLRFFFAALFALPLMVYFGAWGSIAQVTLAQVQTLILIACTTGLFALFLYYKGLARVRASVATLLELAFPLTALLIYVVIYKQTLSIAQYGAGALLLFCIYRLTLLSHTRVTIVTHQVRGKGRGKFLGFPTINMVIPQDLSLQDGIYAARVSFGGKTYNGALHLGPVPTFGQAERALEVFVLDTKNIARASVEKEHIQVEFVSWIRPVIAFESKQALIDQIGRDVVRVRSLLS